MLKVVGVNLTSIGRIEQVDDDDAIALEDAAEHSYRKLLIEPDGRIAGAILLGHPNDAPVVQEAVKDGRDVRPHRDALRAGDWSVLSAEPAAV
jgi:NAD(P)H-nitrite reductase large subunit